MRIRLIVLLFIFAHCLNLCAQVDIAQIKSDRAYWSAEGSGTTLEEAEHDALSQIIRQIRVSILDAMHEEDSSGVINNQVHSDYKQERTVSSFSFATLNNVEMIILQPEPDAKVFRWVAKSEVDKMFEERKTKIIDFVKSGKIAEQRLQIDDALRNYYWALMLTKVHKDPIYVEFNGDMMNCLTYLPLKIKSVIARIRADITECVYENNRYYTQVHFTYNDQDIASVQLLYFDGQSFVGPLTAKNGIGELELLTLPSDNKIRVRYEYGFRNEAMNLDAELRAIFQEISAISIDNAMADIPVKVNVKKKTMVTDSKKQAKMISQADTFAAIPTETIRNKQQLELNQVADNTILLGVMKQVENAIRQGSPESVYSHFTPEGYRLFKTLLTETGKVSLIGKEQTYEFIQANGQILCRFCKVKVKFKNGKSFIENLVFRFNEKSNKIQSIALALSNKAEEDIFNASAKWTEISRFTILQFMEDYQTAYSLKRLDYLEKIFSNDAIIITGTDLKTSSNIKPEGFSIDLGHTNISYTKLNKRQYLTRLGQQFKDREYVHLTFEDNITKVINAPRIPKGTAFAIQINQLYNSPVYSDRGYLTLVLDTSMELPIIHVRLWQPEKKEMLTLDEFMNKFKY